MAPNVPARETRREEKRQIDKQRNVKPAERETARSKNERISGLPCEKTRRHTMQNHDIKVASKENRQQTKQKQSEYSPSRAKRTNKKRRSERKRNKVRLQEFRHEAAFLSPLRSIASAKSSSPTSVIEANGNSTAQSVRLPAPTVAI